MGRAKTLSRLNRLDELIGILKSGEYFISSELAENLNVSTRTLMRDLNILRDKGYPIESDLGRGGGIRLHQNWGVGRLALNYHELIDLLLSLTIMEKIGSPLFLRNLKAVRHKLFASFPKNQRTQLSTLRQRIFIAKQASDKVVSGYISPPSEIGNDAIYEAFTTMRKLHILYEDVKGVQTERVIEPHYLSIAWPAWYVFAWDEGRGEMRNFRLDRIQTSVLVCDFFTLKRDKVFLDYIQKFMSPL